MDPNAVCQVPSSTAEGEDQHVNDLRNELLELVKKGRLRMSEKSVREAKPDMLKKMLQIYKAVKLKKSSQSLTGKFVFVGSKLL